MTRPVLLLLALSGAAGCDNSDDRQRDSELDGLVRERNYLLTHQANLRMAAEGELAGRPVEALPPDSAARLSIFQTQYLATDRQLRQVNSDIESLQKQPNLY